MAGRISPLPADLVAQIAKSRAPLRIDARYCLAASPERLFALLGDLEGITRFFPMIHHAAVEHEGGCAGEGSLRVCSVRGMGKVKERVVWWRRPQGYAYRAEGPLVPLRNHLGVILITPDGASGSILEWRQYLETRFGPASWLFPLMMRQLMNRAVRNIAKLL